MSIFNKQVLVGVLATFMLLPAAAFAANAGKITQAVPDAQILKPSGSVAAKAGGVLDGGDEVSTGIGQAQFVMSDNSKFALPAGSNFKVEEYAEKSPSSPAKAIYSFFKGAFRTVSGLIGKSQGDTYEVRTPVATMGIRGTDYAAVLKKDGQENDGLYIMVFAGTVWVKNKAGTLDITAGKIAYIKDENTAPVFVPDSARAIFERAGINTGTSFNFTLTPSVPFQNPNSGVPRPPVIRVPSVPTPETPASPS